MTDQQIANRPTDAALIAALTEPIQSSLTAEIDAPNAADIAGVTQGIGITELDRSIPMVADEIVALTRLIAEMHPASYELAVKMGILPVSKKQAAPRQPSKHAANTPRTPKVTVLQACACGCGGQTQSSFLPGHDARAKGRMIRALNGKMTQDEIGWKPNAELKAYVASHPEWQARFGGWIATVSEPVTAEIETEDSEPSAE